MFKYNRKTKEKKIRTQTRQHKLQEVRSLYILSNIFITPLFAPS